MRRFVLFLALAVLAAAPLMAADTAPTTPAMCCRGAGAERAVANLDNGVKITMTAKDAAAVAKIQEAAAACAKDTPCCKECPMAAEGVTRTVEKTETGVVITATSKDPATVKKLQEAVAACASGAMKGCCKKGAGAKAMAGKCPHAAATTPSQS